MQHLVEIHHFESSKWVQNGHDKLIRIQRKDKKDALKCAEMWYDKGVRSIIITPMLTEQKINFIRDRTELK